uniref:Zinc finger, CCHC-type n=1 Tax=Tanacetum cinerariifolium TaxID=118510 RepID=A0A6L2LWM0_TANCI|nr:zinc finger, CCHC-type [Tanacetum cinerariifolium]
MFDEVVLSNGYLLNQADKYVYRKFDASGKGVIICLYVDDMLIFGTNQVQVDLTKEFLSSRFSMKDIGKADVILGIRIKHESNVSTHVNTYEKLMPNRGLTVSQLEYSRVIGCLMYATTCTRPDIAFVVEKLSRYTSNPGTQHRQAIQRVLKYLKKTMDYRLIYSSYPSVLAGGAISWASKKQTCITSSTIEYEFVASAAVGKEAEWLKNLLLEIPLWVKPMAPIFIRCDCAATLMAEAHVLQIIPRMCLEPAGYAASKIMYFGSDNIYELDMDAWLSFSRESKFPEKKVLAHERNDKLKEKIIEQENSFRLEEAKRMRLEEEKMLQIVELLLQNSTPLFYVNGDTYATPWSDADQVFILINEKAQHWCLAHLDILSRLVHFYDSEDTYDYEWRDWDFRIVRETYAMCQELNVSTVLVESYNLLKELQDYKLEKCKELMKSISETHLNVLKKIYFIAKLCCQ